MFGENTRFYDLSLKNFVSNKQKWACTNSLLDLWGLGTESLMKGFWTVVK